MTYDNNNIFAKILRKELSCNIVAENAHALAFDDIRPQAPNHILIIPKGKYTDFCNFQEGATSEEVADFWALVTQVVKQLGADETGFRLISNTGLNGGQEVPHFHVHILAGGRLDAIVGA